MKPSIKYSLIKLAVPAAFAQVKIDEETDRLYNTITGINVLVPEIKTAFSTLSLEINTIEIFPEDWEIIRCKFRETVPFNYDFHELNLTADGNRLKGMYKDSGQSSAYPYTVSIALRLENK